MIERASQKIEQAAPNNLFTHTFHFPRASLLEVSYRIRPINFTYTGPVQGLQLTFGVGNPPDFGQGNLQTELLPLPQQFAGSSVYEKELATAKGNVTSREAAVGAAISQRSNLVGVLELVEKNEPGNFKALFEARANVEAAKAEVTEKEVQLAEARALVAQLELENSEGWTPMVTASITRDFDALRLAVLATGNVQFTLDYTLIISRPEDVGATYVAPANFAEGR